MPIRFHVNVGQRLIRGGIVGDFTLVEIFDAIDGAEAWLAEPPART